MCILVEVLIVKYHLMSLDIKMWYDVDEDGSILMDARGREVRKYLRSIIHSHVRNCYDKNQYNSSKLDDIVSDFHRRYPNPEGSQVDNAWIRPRIIEIISNHRNHLTRRAREILRREKNGLPPEPNHGRPHNCHDREWVDAMKRGAAEPSSQHHLARMTQIERYGSSHFGSGGIATFHQEFVCYDIIIFTIIFYQNIINSV